MPDNGLTGGDAMDLLIYVGTYTGGKSRGIYIYRWNTEDEYLRSVGTMEDITNPSFLEVSPDGRYLFSVSEVGDYQGRQSGAVHSYSIDQRSGGLTPIGRQPSLGAYPCYLCVDKTSRFVLAANYGNGSVSVFPILDGGRLGAPTDTVQHHGSGKDPVRQESAHAHCVCLDPANRYAFVADLGLDRVMIYRFESSTGKLAPNTRQPWVQVAAGSGPRHFVFHPDGAFAYLVNELNSTINVFSYDSEPGTLEQLQTISTLPDGYSGDNTGADIPVSPCGGFLYSSNRGRDEIVIFRIAEGRLSGIGYASTQGKTPRNFVIEPSGNFMLAANRDSDSIMMFRIGRSSGKLKPIRKMDGIPSPVCLKLTQHIGMDC